MGDGLTQEAAADLELNVGTAVGASLIDAHAGGLGKTRNPFILPVKHLSAQIVTVEQFSFIKSQV